MTFRDIWAGFLRKIYRKVIALLWAVRYAEGVGSVFVRKKGKDHMPDIRPVSDLRNYGVVLEKVSAGSPVYLTRNGHGAYSIRDIRDEEYFQKAEAMIQLLCELNAGIRSAEEEGWISEEELREHFRSKRNTR